MDDPITAGPLLALLGVIAAGLIAGTFQLMRNGRQGNPDNPSSQYRLTNGLLRALTDQTGAMKDLTIVLREATTEQRQAHSEMLKSMTTLLERTRQEDG